MTRRLKALCSSGLATKEGKISCVKQQLLSYLRKENSLQVITCPPRLPKPHRSLLMWEKSPRMRVINPKQYYFQNHLSVYGAEEKLEKNTLSTMRENWRHFKLLSFRKNQMHLSVTIWEFLSSNPG